MLVRQAPCHWALSLLINWVLSQYAFYLLCLYSCCSSFCYFISCLYDLHFTFSSHFTLLFWRQSHYVVVVGLQLSILTKSGLEQIEIHLYLLPKCWYWLCVLSLSHLAKFSTFMCRVRTVQVYTLMCPSSLCYC